MLRGPLRIPLPRPLRYRLAALLCAVAAVGIACSRERPPNVVLLMSDDQGWGETGYAGHPQVRTPELDRMAAAGLRFDRFYAAAPVCSPTRASVLTGRHPDRSGVLSWHFALRPEEISIASLLARAGYRTGHFGKWHLGPVRAGSPVGPRAFGFEESLSDDNIFEIDPVLSRDGGEPAVHPGEGSQVIVDAAVSFMRRAHDEGKPFFAAVWFSSPHAPYRGLPGDLALYPEVREPLRSRFAEITAMDRAIGSLRESLVAMGEARNTLVWFCSDNGPPRQVHQRGGLAFYKGLIFEGGIRVPGILEWPDGLARPGRASDVPVVTSDIFPTILDVAGVRAPDRPLDGVSVKPLLDGALFERPPIGFWVQNPKSERHNPPWLDPKQLVGRPRSNGRPIHFSNFRHPVARTHGFSGQAAWMEDRYKLLAFDTGFHAFFEGRGTLRSADGERVFLLFDIRSDPAERQDVAHDHPDIVTRMAAALEAWQTSVDRSQSGADYR